MLVHAQPQYRVTVSAPVAVSNIPDIIRVNTTFITLCFRESDSASENITYCPLGMTTVYVGADFPPEELPLQGGGS